MSSTMRSALFVLSSIEADGMDADELSAHVRRIAREAMARSEKDGDLQRVALEKISRLTIEALT